MAGTKSIGRHKGRPAFVVGRAAYEQVAAVEGLALSPAARAMFARLDREHASPAERLVAVITANSAPNAVHVVPHPDGWAVRAAGAAAATAAYPTRDEAIARAKALARAGRGDVLIHGPDGRLIRRATCGGAMETAKR